MEIIKLREDYIKLGQALKAGGIASNGAEAKMMIIEGYVKVNGVVETQRGKKLVSGDIVTYQEEEIQIQ